MDLIKKKDNPLQPKLVMSHGQSGGRLNTEKAALRGMYFMHQGETDPGVLSISLSSKTDEMQKLTEIQKCAMDNL